MHNSTSGKESPFAIRGIKGLYWRPEDYLNVVKILPEGNFNFIMLCYTMCPESSIRWRAPYTASVRKTVEQIADFCARHGIELCLAFNPIVASQTMDPVESGMPFHPSVRTNTWFRDFFIDFWYAGDRFGEEKDRIPEEELVSDPFTFSSKRDFELICAKCEDMAGLGVRSFALCLDDLDPTLSLEDQEVFSSSEEAQAHFVQQLNDALHTTIPASKLYFCATHYCNKWAEAHADYTAYMGKHLPEDVTWFWTGPEIISPTLSANDVVRFRELTGGKKPILWMNYPCNDFLKRKLQLAPFERTTGNLWPHLTGIMINPMVQPETSKIQILTMAAYLNNPEAYEPKRAQDNAIRHIIQEEAVPSTRRYFDIYSTHYKNIEALEAKDLSEEALTDLKKASREIEDTLVALDETMTNRALCRELVDGLRRLASYIEVYDLYLAIHRAVEAEQIDLARSLIRQILERKQVYETVSTEVGADALYVIFLIEALEKRLDIIEGGTDASC